MTVGEPSGGPSRAKLLGFGLIGVGVVAGGLGAVTLWSDGSSPSAAPPATSQVQPPPPQTPPETSILAPPPPPKVTRPPETSTEQPAPPPAQPPTSEQQAPGAGSVNEQIVVRVFNNSTISGLAHRASEDFKRSGYQVPEEGNYAQSTIPTTTFYYRAGTGEEQLAKEIAAYFGAKAEPRIPEVKHFGDGIVVIVTNDYKGPTKVK